MMIPRKTLFLFSILISVSLGFIGIKRSDLEKNSAGKKQSPQLRLDHAQIIERLDSKSLRYKIIPKESHLKQGDSFQITYRPNRMGYLLVGAFSENSFTLLYPKYEQKGLVRARWSYSLPAPNQHYRFDGKTTSIVALFRLKKLPETQKEKRALLENALRKGAASTTQIGTLSLERHNGNYIESPLYRNQDKGKVISVLNFKSGHEIKATNLCD